VRVDTIKPHLVCSEREVNDAEPRFDLYSFADSVLICRTPEIQEKGTLKKI